MSVKSLFHKNKQAVTVSKYLRNSATNTLGDGIESDAHLKASLSKSLYFLPDTDYSNPENFVRFGSAEEYYKNAFSYVANYYPYDGSFLEKTTFYNDLAPIEKYVLDQTYPRSTGYITNGANYGTITPHASGYYSSSVGQYVRIKGGPHSGSIYSEAAGRTSNLEFGGPSGSTVEFFFKKNSHIDKDRNSERQVILDAWNGAPLADASYGRMRIEIVSASSGEDRFLVTLKSGSNGFVTASVPSTGTLTLSDGKWRNFSFVFNTSGSTPIVDFYQNGSCIETITTGSGVVGAVTGTMIATLGALQTDVEDAPGVAEGYGKLSASLDEFRFWKKARNPEEIGRWWFDDVGGGSNKYDANVSLGVYLKFNAGITQTSSIDKVLLDYSGRLSNGVYVGYDSTYSRNTGSAIDALELTSVKETADPIIRTDNPRYSSLYTEYIRSGSYYDGLNSARLLNHLPSWIVESEEGAANEILSLTQIIASYFDTIYNQLDALKRIKHMSYNSGSLSASMNEFPHNDRLLSSIGFEAPEIFANIGTLEQFLKRDEQIVFDQNLTDIKNAIYKNIYNNINFILKSKGNEKSIRNFIRCLGVDEEIITLNTYSNNSDYKLRSSYKTDVSEKKYVDFSGLQDVENASATVYQYYDSSNTNSVGLITGSTSLQDFAFSLQADVIFPNKQHFELVPYDVPAVVSSSLFGFHTPDVSNSTSTNLTWQPALRDYGLQIYAVKSPGQYPKVYSPTHEVMDAFFVVKNRAGTTLLTSSIFSDVYDNKKWNFTLSLRPRKYPFNDGVLGASLATDNYILQLYGINCENGVIKNTFTKEEPITYAVGSNIIESPKRIYAGAHRTNYTGSLITYSDVKISSVRYWTDYLTSGSLISQALEVDSFGRVNPYRNAYSFQTNAPSRYIPKIQTLALDWDFETISASNLSGRFDVSDFSSGSSDGQYPSNYQGSMLSSINLRQHTGRGDFFPSSATPVRKEYVYTNKLQPPEYISSEDMVTVMSSDDETFGINIRPETYYFAIERSLYRSISDRMLHLFASIEEFNNLIGEPVNQYRFNYKRMEKMRELFFQKVKNNTVDLDKYVTYYKWLDDAMTDMIQQLLPGSARYAPEVRKVIESHVLERPKIQYGFPLMKEVANFGAGLAGPVGAAGGSPAPEELEGNPNDAVSYPPRRPPDIGVIAGIIPVLPTFDRPNVEFRPTPPIPPGAVSLGTGLNPRIPNFSWQFNHAPVNELQSYNPTWWRFDAERFGTVLSGPGGNLYSRQAIQRAARREHQGSRLVRVQSSFAQSYGGGANQAKNKRSTIRDLTFGSFESFPDEAQTMTPDRKRRVNFQATVDRTPATATMVINDSGAIINGETFVLTDFNGTATTYTINGGVAPALGGGSGGAATVGFLGVGGGSAGKIAAAASIVIAVNGTTDANYTAVSNGVDTVTITQDSAGAQGNKALTSGVTGVTAQGFLGAESDYFNGEQVTIFSAMSSNVQGGFNDLLNSSGMSGIDITNLHQDNSSTENNNQPLQGPFTRQYVGGVGARHVAPFATKDRNERYSMTITTGGGTVSRVDGSAIAKGQYLRGPGAKMPVNIENIQTVVEGHATSRGIRRIGNFQHNYEVVFGGDRAATNIDLAFNTSNYNYSMPTAFFTSLDMRAHGRTGSADYPAPRQIANRRTTKSIVVATFAAPGSKLDSKQLFRDVNSNQYSPNNALPFRNIPVRQAHNSQLRAHTLLGGYESGNPTVPSIHKTPSNPTRRLEISTTSPTTTYITGTFYDNAYVTRPIPAGDSTQWFFALSGSDTPLYSEYVLSGNRYPANIPLPVTTWDSAPAFGTAVYLDTAGKYRYIWGPHPEVAPWTQLREGDTNGGSYFSRKNIYQLDPVRGPLFRIPYPPSAEANRSPVSSRTTTDQAGNTLTHYYRALYEEAPVTSRYKPLRHVIRTPLGDPSRTSRNLTTVGMKYSYGNALMGFANRELNVELQGRRKFAHGLIKRPYEIMRDQRATNVPAYVNGINLIKLMEYDETIYPQEVYTYLSGTRSRYNFANSFWKNDKAIDLSSLAALSSYVSLRTPSIQSAYNKMMPRVTGSYTTSQGFTVELQDQAPYNSLDASYQRATGPGSASIWPLDTYMFGDWNSTLVTILTASTPVVFADAATMACGELMMTHYGSINDQITNASFVSSPGSAVYQTSSVNSAQYVYNIPATTSLTTTIPAIAATGAITASHYHGEPYATAVGEIEFGIFATGDQLGGASAGPFKVQIPDGTNTYEYLFDSAILGNSYDGAVGYIIGVGDGAGGYLTATQVRDALYTAIDASRTNTTSLNIAAPASAGSYTIELTAGTAGSGFNSFSVATDAGAGSTGIIVAGWSGGAEYSLNSLTLSLTDVAHGTVSYIFDAATTVAGSTDLIIGCQDATSTALVAQAIYQTIALSKTAAAINITPTVPGGVGTNIVPLTADVAGTGMNGKAIAGTFITTGPPYGQNQDFAGGSATITDTVYLPEVRSPGSAYTRPPWDAGKYRKYVDGPNRGSNLVRPGAAYPSYNTYNDYVINVRAAGQDHTIIPEFRISNHVSSYQESGPLSSVIQSSLEITGANSSNYDGTNTSFYDRYCLTDKMEFLDDLMPLNEQSRDFLFNNHPRHFKMTSEGVIKLLPYDGFYPVDRTLDIAKSFSDTYKSYAVYEGDDASTTQAWRSIYKPYFAPGIMYNSIKSGMAVDFPVRRALRNEQQFSPVSATTPLKGALSGALSSVAAGQIPGNQRRQTSDLNWNNADVNKFFWADRLPFESIMDPASFAEQGNDKPMILADINEFLHYDVSGSISDKGLDDSLYKKMVSNFLANVPRFFLKKKYNKYGDEGYLTKFVSQFGNPPKDSQQTTAPERTVKVDHKSAYMMEIGLLKTDNFNMYSNPYAFGIPTATGSVGWPSLTANQIPSGTAWPKHRGEFAPFTPPYYYGPSLVRLLFIPSRREEYTLDQIINNQEGEFYVQYLNESGSYFDAISGSFVDRDGNNVATTATPNYGWNRAWKNRMDLDASVSVLNEFPLAGGSYRSSDPNKWTIMPKWEAPILDFSTFEFPSYSASYDFSSSVTVTEYTASTSGMWHQYGVAPSHNNGVYMYIKDIPTGKEEEYDRVALAQPNASNTSINYSYVKKVPKFVIDAGRQVKSLANLCGFDPDEIIRKGFDFDKAKRMGELPEDNEKTLSEAILALPIYRDEKDNIRFVTLGAPADKLGPQIKEFRKKFTKYSLPPAFANQLQDMVPKGYPTVSQIINPFGDDDYDEILEGGTMSHIPVVYLMEHTVELSKQDLADIWQGIMPQCGNQFSMSVSSINHYMPGDLVEDTPTQFPEVLRKQIELNVEETGHPRYDLLDVAHPNTPDGLYPEIRWLVFKVKERGLSSYSEMVMEEIDGPDALGYDNLRGFMAQSGMSEQQLRQVDHLKDTFAKNSYLIKHSVHNPTYNWPYDYCSLVELAKINTQAGFRPDLAEEYQEETTVNGEGFRYTINLPEGSNHTFPMITPVNINRIT